MNRPISFITPLNFQHKAGDGLKTRRHNLVKIHPALQANCGATQCTYLLCEGENTVEKSEVQTETKSFRIRKLTPKECYRLMGFKDDEYERAAKVNSDTQLYKQAGNSIVVNVLTSIFEELGTYGILE